MADNRSNRELMACSECGAATVVQSRRGEPVEARSPTCRRCGTASLERIEDPIPEE